MKLIAGVSLFLALVAGHERNMPTPLQDIPYKRATRVFRLGGPDAADPYTFARTPSLIVDADKFIYARLSSEATILVLRPDGGFARRIGRKGEGPGEFQVAQAHGFVGDTLWVRNWPAPRMSLFRKDGTHLSTRQTPVEVKGARLSAPAGLSGLLTQGRAYVHITALSLDDSDARAMQPLLVGTREMKTIDTVALIPNPKGLYVPSVGYWAFAPIPMSPLYHVSSTGTEIAVAEWNRSGPGTVTLRVIGPDGAQRLRRNLSFPARPIPRHTRDSLLAEALTKARPQLDAARRKGTLAGSSNERLVEQGLDLPDRFPPVRTVLVGIDGTLWLERFGEGRAGDWLVLSRTGDALFRVQIPSTLDVHAVSATDVWGTDRDELDVSYIVRMTLK